MPAVVHKRPVVRVVLPAGPVVGHETDFEAGLGKIERAGCEVRWDGQRAVKNWRDYYSGTDVERLTEFQSALSESDVDIIWCGRGGSGSNRIADLIVTHARRVSRPKPIIGFSDITAIINPLSQQLGWITYHGPVVTSLAKAEISTDIDTIMKLVCGRTSRMTLPKRIEGSAVDGRLYGGNLTVLASMIGTSTAPKNESGSIWLLEDVGESAYRLDRSFNQLIRSGLFDGAAAIWLGDLGLSDDNQENEMRERIKADAPCRVITDAPAGHRGPLVPLPVGARIEINGDQLQTKWADE